MIEALKDERCTRCPEERRVRISRDKISGYIEIGIASDV